MEDDWWWRRRRLLIGMKAAKFDSDRSQNLADDYPCGAILRPHADGALCHTGLAALGIGFPDAGRRTSALWKVKVLPSLT
jgi:hypothetical protein